MVADIRVAGGEDFKKLARDLRAAGDRGKGLRKELYKRIDAATRPLRDEVKRAEAEQLPHRGGLAKLATSRRISTSKRNTGRSAGIRLTQKNTPSWDRGRLRHPVFGNRNQWVSQDIKGGFWSDTLDSSESQEIVRQEILAAVDEISRRLT
jgi:hypothetical protein